MARITRRLAKFSIGGPDKCFAWKADGKQHVDGRHQEVQENTCYRIIMKRSQQIKQFEEKLRCDAQKDKDCHLFDEGWSFLEVCQKRKKH